MYKLEKTILAALVAGVLVTTGSEAQTIKKTTKPAATVKKAPSTPVKAAATPAVLKNKMDSLSAAIGVSFSNSLNSQGISDINTEVLTKTINASLKGGKTAFTPEDANKFIGEYFQKLTEEKGAVFRVEGEKFLEENKKKEGVVTTESGLQYQIIKAGEGPKPAATDKVKTHYHGTLTNGTVFDSSVERGEPVEFPVNGVIKGWTEALQLMPVGSKWKLFIPYQLAYGERAAGPQIPAYSALVFEVELLEIVK
ncbi:FKBP-type peptidyl-prolyl cis-trans isomerase [Dyadobacter chenhuakuii]|uniref:Peptidyl-prolyl cis-trans isomerase n=1 Tax=Dyadobacter chenhuakuii TaxID=2909339 RepID=A0ABY4XF25_9BACT|nr:FKBP-type peptidyl-prolyl cis-trans isomerase [Dyadobacter chenhuakuii]MCF2491844.1 FKBP-type peptidyl-prolyl cis-trans isomerase [Dyadobacter chenhuakuii]USJ28992.1 FKBP-type peptidyl-prolyl cis-trans isomerase [Dyadobacter chenhuakuii]